MATIVLAYDPNMYWDEFLKKYNLRHELIFNDPNKFILYYYDDFHILKIGYEFGLFCQKKLMEDAIQQSQGTF